MPIQDPVIVANTTITTPTISSPVLSGTTTGTYTLGGTPTISSPTIATIKSASANTPPVFQDSNGTEIGTTCRSWVNFNGTGTVAIRASFNVTSITDNGVGDYTVNFTTAMPDANYSLACTLQSIGGPNKGFILQNELANPAAGSCRLMVLANGATTAAADDSYVFASFFR